jgi:hypothetical protein
MQFAIKGCSSRFIPVPENVRGGATVRCRSTGGRAATEAVAEAVEEAVHVPEAEAAAVCGVKFVPISGFRPGDRGINYMSSHADEIEV